MKGAIRQYKFPIIACLLMLLSFSAWVRWDISRIKEHFYDRMKRQSYGVFDTMRGILLSLESKGRLSSIGLNTILSQILKDSPLVYVSMIDDTGIVYALGNKAGELPDIHADGEHETEDLYMIFRQIQLSNKGSVRPNEDEVLLNEKYDLEFSRNQFTLVLGFRKPPPPQWNLSSIMSLFWTSAFAALFILAFTFSWIMTIRSGKLSTELELVRARSAHLEDLNLIAAGLAHETKNPLGLISALAQSIRREPGVSDECKTMCEQISDEVDRATSRLGDFMAFAKRRESVLVKICIHKVLDEVSELMAIDFKDGGVDLFLNVEDAQIYADDDMLRQILVNLLMNSLQASTSGRKVVVGFRITDNGGELTVEDNGKGISPELLPNIFKPYVSGSSSGHGLGLAIVHRLVHQQNWDIRSESKIGEGTRMIISQIQPAN